MEENVLKQQQQQREEHLLYRRLVLHLLQVISALIVSDRHHSPSHNGDDFPIFLSHKMTIN